MGDKQLSKQHSSMPRIEIKRKKKFSLLSLCGSGVEDDVVELRDQVAALRAQMKEMETRLAAVEARPAIQEPAAIVRSDCAEGSSACVQAPRRKQSKPLLRVADDSSQPRTPKRNGARRSSAPPRPGKVDSDLAARLSKQAEKAATQGVNVESVAPGEKKALTSFRASTNTSPTISQAALMDRSGNMWVDGRPSQRNSMSLDHSGSPGMAESSRFSVPGGSTDDEAQSSRRLEVEDHV